MAKQPVINGKVVERSYEDYKNDQYLVNRRYQRKLVWELEEKQAFIDSLANGYPVPLFLFAKSNYKGSERNEIIDGMQRLNAIFSFIENQYPSSSGEYFDLSTTALTKALSDDGKLIQKEPRLNRDICVRIVSYELPYSVYDESNPAIIDEVFRRINANGKHLSKQENRRQIGSKMRMVNYHEKAVIILRITCDNGAALFDNAYYTRSGASNDPEPVSAEAMPAFFMKFV